MGVLLSPQMEGGGYFAQELHDGVGTDGTGTELLAVCVVLLELTHGTEPIELT